MYNTKNETIIALMNCFPGSFINANFEIILHKNTNQYFLLEDCETAEDIFAKSIEWISRAAAKATPYSTDRKNQIYREKMQEALNQFWKKDFSEDDFELIYQHLGNAVNHQKTLEFIRSGFDLRVLNG